MATWEAGEAARNDRVLYARSADEREVRQDREKATEVVTFSTTEYVLCS